MMEAARTSETLVNFYQTTRRYNPEDSHLHTRRRENFKSNLGRKKTKKSKSDHYIQSKLKLNCKEWQNERSVSPSTGFAKPRHEKGRGIRKNNTQIPKEGRREAPSSPIIRVAYL
jgi:hypothetical protein